MESQALLDSERGGSKWSFMVSSGQDPEPCSVLLLSPCGHPVKQVHVIIIPSLTEQKTKVRIPQDHAAQRVSQSQSSGLFSGTALKPLAALLLCSLRRPRTYLIRLLFGNKPTDLEWKAFSLLEPRSSCATPPALAPPAEPCQLHPGLGHRRALWQGGLRLLATASLRLLSVPEVHVPSHQGFGAH